MFRMTPGIGSLHSGAYRSFAFAEHQGATGSPIPTTEHPLAENARNGPHDIAHGFEFLAGDLIVIPKAETIGSEDRPDLRNITLLPSVEHPLKPLLGMVDVVEPLAEMRMTLSEPRKD
jgi:hypothetical protein